MTIIIAEPSTRTLWEIKGRGYYAVCTAEVMWTSRPIGKTPELMSVTGWFESPTMLPPEAFDLSKYLPLIGKGLPKGHEQHVGRKNRQHFESTGAVKRKGEGR